MAGFVRAMDYEAEERAEKKAVRDALINARDHMESAADRLDHLGSTEHAGRLRRAADECRNAIRGMAGG